MSRVKRVLLRNVLFAVLGVGQWCTCTERAWGLGTEHYGNAPIDGAWGFCKELLAVVNVRQRIYWREVNGDPQFFFRGKTDDLNQVLQHFRQLPGADHVIVLVPGPGETNSLDGKLAIPHDWHLHAPGGFYKARADGEKGTSVMTKHPTLTIHVNGPRPALTTPLEQIQRFIAELNDDAFGVREKAMFELEKLGRSVEPVLRRALSKMPPPEAKKRIERLLEKLPGVELDRIQLPEGVTVLGLEDLRDRYVQGLQSGSIEIRGMALTNLAGLCNQFDDVLPVILRALKEDPNEYVRRSAAAALARQGKKAVDALPILRAGLKDSDAGVRIAFQQAIVTIETARSDSAQDERTKQKRAIREYIAKYLLGIQRSSQR